MSGGGNKVDGAAAGAAAPAPAPAPAVDDGDDSGGLSRPARTVGTTAAASVRVEYAYKFPSTCEYPVDRSYDFASADNAHLVATRGWSCKFSPTCGKSTATSIPSVDSCSFGPSNAAQCRARREFRDCVSMLVRVPLHRVGVQAHHPEKSDDAIDILEATRWISTPKVGTRTRARARLTSISKYTAWKVSLERGDVNTAGLQRFQLAYTREHQQAR